MCQLDLSTALQLWLDGLPFYWAQVTTLTQRLGLVVAPTLASPGILYAPFLTAYTLPLSSWCVQWLDVTHWLCSMCCLLKGSRALVAQRVKNVPAMQEIWVWSLGSEDPLEKGMVTHSSILAWRIPWTEEPGGLHTARRVAKNRTWLSLHFLHTFKIIALDNCKFFILFFLFRFISRMVRPQGSPRELVVFVFVEWIYGPPRALAQSPLPR